MSFSLLPIKESSRENVESRVEMFKFRDIATGSQSISFATKVQGLLTSSISSNLKGSTGALLIVDPLPP